MNYDQLLELFKELYPKTRHKHEEVLDMVISLRLLQADFLIEDVKPHEATRILSSEIPKIVDDLLSLKQILGYLEKDVEKSIRNLSINLRDKPEFPALNVKELKIYANNYRTTIKKLRRKTKAEVEELRLEHEAKAWETIGLGKTIDHWFKDDSAINTKLIEALNNSGIYYDFQLIFISISNFIKTTPGLGKKCLTNLSIVTNDIFSQLGENDIPEISLTRLHT